MMRKIAVILAFLSVMPSAQAEQRTLSQDFSPNPLVLAAVTSRAEVDVTKLGVRNPQCTGYVGQAPVHVLQLPAELTKMKIRAVGGDFLYARFGKRYICSPPHASGEDAVLYLPSWPAGSIELFLGHHSHGQSVTAEVVIEDANRPVAAATPSVQAEQHTVRPDFSPNPLVLAAATSRAEVDLMKFGVRDPNCVGYVGQTPVYVLQLPAALIHVKIRAVGGDILYARFGKQYGCNASRAIGADPELHFDSWPAGTVELFLGHHSHGHSVTAEIVIEDPNRPVQLDWESAPSIPRIELSGNEEAPLVLGRMTPEGARAKSKNLRVHFVDSCRTALFRQLPDFKLEIAKPMDAELSVRAPAVKCWNIRGPLGGDRRHIPDTLAGAEPLRSDRWEPGTYGVWIGTPTEEPQAYHFIAKRNKTAIAEPWRAPEIIGKKLALKDRDLLHHFPLLSWDKLYEQDEVRQRVYAAASAELFVFPVRDLEPGTAELLSSAAGDHGEDWPGARTERPPVLYPKKNEPVLRIQNYILTADLLLFKVTEADLSDNASGPLALPDAPRNPHSSYARLYAEGEALIGPAEYQPYAKKSLAAGQCRDGYFRTAIARDQELRNRPGVPYPDRPNARVYAEEDAKARKACKLDEFDKSMEAMWRKLIAARTARRASIYPKLRGHAEQVLAGGR